MMVALNHIFDKVPVIIVHWIHWNLYDCSKAMDLGEHCHVTKLIKNNQRFERRSKTARIYPGGLAVSRSIVDLNHCEAVIATPDLLRWRLDSTTSCGTHRFVLATDGLWDVTNDDKVGALAAQRDPTNGSAITPKMAVHKVMEHCLERGGSMDDVTVL